MPKKPRRCDCGVLLPRYVRRCRKCREAYKTIRKAFRDELRAPKLPPREPLEDPNRNPEHLDWIRDQPCAVCGRPGPSEAAHVRVRTGGGMGLKPADHWTVPLCHDHHYQQHRLGHRGFDALHSFDMRALAEDYAARSPYIKQPALAATG